MADSTIRWAEAVARGLGALCASSPAKGDTRLTLSSRLADFYERARSSENAPVATRVGDGDRRDQPSHPATLRARDETRSDTSRRSGPRRPSGRRRASIRGASAASSYAKMPAICAVVGGERKRGLVEAAPRVLVLLDEQAHLERMHGSSAKDALPVRTASDALLCETRQPRVPAPIGVLSDRRRLQSPPAIRLMMRADPGKFSSTSPRLAVRRAFIPSGLRICGHSDSCSGWARKLPIPSSSDSRRWRGPRSRGLPSSSTPARRPMRLTVEAAAVRRTSNGTSLAFLARTDPAASVLYDAVEHAARRLACAGRRRGIRRRRTIECQAIRPRRAIRLSMVHRTIDVRATCATHPSGRVFSTGVGQVIDGGRRGRENTDSGAIIRSATRGASTVRRIGRLAEWTSSANSRFESASSAANRSSSESAISSPSAAGCRSDADAQAARDDAGGQPQPRRGRRTCRSAASSAICRRDCRRGRSERTPIWRRNAVVDESAQKSVTCWRTGKGVLADDPCHAFQVRCSSSSSTRKRRRSFHQSPFPFSATTAQKSRHLRRRTAANAPPDRSAPAPA